MQSTASDTAVRTSKQDDLDRSEAEAAYIGHWLKTSDQDVNVNVINVARAAIAEFGRGAVAAMQKRSDNHLRHGQRDGAEFWRRVAKAVRLLAHR